MSIEGLGIDATESVLRGLVRELLREVIREELGAALAGVRGQGLGVPSPNHGGTSAPQPGSRTVPRAVPRTVSGGGSGAPSVHHIARGAVTERAVNAAAADGARLVIGPRAVLTPLAKDRARVLGVVIERTSATA